MMDYRQGIGLRALDAQAGMPKGSAFRCFKHLRAQWQEGRDYLVFDHERDHALIQTLKNAGQVYASSVNVVLVSPIIAAQMLIELQTPEQANR